MKKTIVKMTANKHLKKGELVSAGDVSPYRKPNYQWYEVITPFLGIKWGGEITLVGYGWLNGSIGLRYAAVIVASFLFLEWCQMAWCEFKRRVQQ